MIGIKYRYELNEAKKTMKLRPTNGTVLTAMVGSALYIGVAYVAINGIPRVIDPATYFTPTKTPNKK